MSFFKLSTLQHFRIFSFLSREDIETFSPVDRRINKICSKYLKYLDRLSLEQVNLFSLQQHLDLFSFLSLEDIETLSLINRRMNGIGSKYLSDFNQRREGEWKEQWEFTHNQTIRYNPLCDYAIGTYPIRDPHIVKDKQIIVITNSKGRINVIYRPIKDQTIAKCIGVFFWETLNAHYLVFYHDKNIYLKNQHTGQETHQIDLGPGYAEEPFLVQLKEDKLGLIFRNFKAITVQYRKDKAKRVGVFKAEMVGVFNLLKTSVSPQASIVGAAWLGRHILFSAKKDGKTWMYTVDTKTGWSGIPKSNEVCECQTTDVAIAYDQFVFNAYGEEEEETLKSNVHLDSPPSTNSKLSSLVTSPKFSSSVTTTLDTGSKHSSSLATTLDGPESPSSLAITLVTSPKQPSVLATTLVTSSKFRSITITMVKTTLVKRKWYFALSPEKRDGPIHTNGETVVIPTVSGCYVGDINHGMARFIQTPYLIKPKLFWNGGLIGKRTQSVIIKDLSKNRSMGFRINPDFLILDVCGFGNGRDRGESRNWSVLVADKRIPSKPYITVLDTLNYLPRVKKKNPARKKGEPEGAKSTTTTSSVTNTSQAQPRTLRKNQRAEKTKGGVQFAESAADAKERKEGKRSTRTTSRVARSSRARQQQHSSGARKLRGTH